MIAALLLAAAAPSVETAERAFASAAQTKGQWTAFRAFAAPDARMLLNGPQPAAPFLRDRKDPAVSVMWEPAHTITSCDGTLAFSTGPTRRRDNLSAGRYLTLWRYDRAGWRWIFDAGSSDVVAAPRNGKVDAIRATCDRAVAPSLRTAHSQAGGASRDRSMRWNLSSLDGQHYFLTIIYRISAGWKRESLEIS